MSVSLPVDLEPKPKFQRQERIKIQITATITRQNLADLLCTAFEEGIGYWLDHYEVTKHPTIEPEPEQGFQRTWSYENAAFEGGELTLYTDDEPKVPHTLTDKKLIKGIKKASKEGFIDRVDGEDWLADVDAGDADNIIQLAVFGELVYG